MEVTIRHAEANDFQQLGAFFKSPEVTIHTGQIPFRSEDYWKEMFDVSDKNKIQLVAEIDERIIGQLGLNLINSPRRKHVASFGIAVHPEAQGKGVGKKLMQAMIDLADNWLNLVRIELDVFTSNEKAIDLYRSMGFEIEGETRMDCFQNGRYVNSYRMSRIRPDMISES